MALEKTHINNIDLFLNSNSILDVEAENISTGERKRFASRSQFLDHIINENGTTPNFHSKCSLSGMLAYRILTNRDFFGYRVKLVDNGGKTKSGTLVKRGTMGRSLRKCLYGDSKQVCMTASQPKRHRQKKAYLVNSKTGDIKEFSSTREYRDYARENGLTQSVAISKIRGKKLVGDNQYLVASRDYLYKNLLKSYYWVKDKDGKFVKGFPNFTDLCSFLKEKNVNKVRSAIGNGTKVKGKTVIVRKELDKDKFYD